MILRQAISQTPPRAALSGMVLACLWSSGAAMAADSRLLNDPLRASSPVGQGLMNLSDNLWLGFELSNPYSTMSREEAQLLGHHNSLDSSLKAMSLAPVLGWQINKQWSLDAGLDIQHAESGIRYATVDPLAMGDAGLSATRSSADSWEAGYNLGMNFSLSERTHLGWHYRSTVTHTLKGNSGSVNLDLQDGDVVDYKVRNELGLPAITSLGFSHQAAPRWTLSGQYSWVEWSRFEGLSVPREDGSNTQAFRDYQDSWTLSLRSEFRYDPQWTLRGGLQYSQTPAPDLMGDSTHLALGAAYRSNQRLSVEMAYTHALIKQQSLAMDRDYYNSLADRDIGNPDNAHTFGLGLRYAF